MSENDSQKPPVILDEHCGMAAQKATNIRRHESDVRADQESSRLGRSELEKNLFAGPATSWQQAAEKAAYLLRLLAATAEGQDPRYKRLIEADRRFSAISPVRGSAKSRR